MVPAVIGGQELARRLAARASLIAAAHGFAPNISTWSFPLAPEGIEAARAFGAYRALQDIITELTASAPVQRVVKGMSQVELQSALRADDRVHISTVEAAIYMQRDPRTLQTWARNGVGEMQPINGAQKHMRWRLDDLRRALGVEPRA
jgi:hypothetical protein